MVEVTKVHYEGGYKLSLEFTDGSHGVADLEAEIHGALESLKDKRVFRRARIEDGTVAWPGDMDLAPARLYALAHGLPIPQSFESADANEAAMGLRVVRELSGKTQSEFAEELGIPQSNLSRLEGRDDMKLSSIRRYVEALGGKLEVIAVVGGKRVRVA
jgi:DNA-binding XRE family transcriptional regulator